MRRRPWDEEHHAAKVLEQLLGGTAERVDPGGGATPLHDFDLHVEGGGSIAVEVTRHNVPATLGVLAEVDKRDWHFPELRYVWVVSVVSVFNVTALHRQIAELLREFEDAGISQLLGRAPRSGGK